MGSKPTILITGASGFLGSELVRHFHALGWQVVVLVRDPEHYHDKSVRYMKYDLTKPVDAAIFKGADYLVHAAYIKVDRQHSDAFELNLEGAKRLLMAARKHSLKKCIFISSMSAHDGAISIYGRQKLAIEKLFDQPTDVILRPGLIIGNGGIAKNIVKFMKSKHVVPLIGGGHQPLQVISARDMARAVERSITKKIHGTLTIASPHVYTYKSFYKLVSQKLHIRVVFIPLPYGVMLVALKLAELLPFSLNIGADNLKGLKKLRANTSGDIKKLGMELEPIEKSIQDLDAGEA